MTIDITKITPEKLAEMNDSLMVDNQHLRGQLEHWKANWDHEALESESLRKQLAEALTDSGNAHVSYMLIQQQLADSQKQVVMLREWAVEAVEFVGNMKWSPSIESQGRRVIAATEPKP